MDFENHTQGKPVTVHDIEPSIIHKNSSNDPKFKCWKLIRTYVGTISVISLLF